MIKSFLCCVCFLLLISLVACTTQKEELKEFDLKQVSFSRIPGWTSDNFNEVLPALEKSCERADTVWLDFCAGLKKQTTSKEIRRYIEKTLDAYLVISKGSKTGIFTGYYEASLKGALDKDDIYQTPIYGVPSDLVQVDLKDFNLQSNSPRIVGRVEAGKLVPYYERKDQAKMEAPVLLWVDSPVDAFILHIQGSGRVETKDGVVHVGYAGNNGHGFVGIGSIMSKEGLLEPGKASMPHIRAWLKNNPDKAEKLMAQNPRFIFFRILPNSDGPIGASGVSLTAKRSIAIDNQYIPFHTPVFLETTDAEGKKIQKLVVAQDIGSAIKGPIRADFFWGYGEEAFQEAGRMRSKGSYYILWPKGKTPLAS